MLKIDKEVAKKINKLLLDIINSLEADISALTNNEPTANEQTINQQSIKKVKRNIDKQADQKIILDKKKALVNILFKLTSSVTKLSQMQQESPQLVTGNLTIEDNRVINNYLKKLSSNE